jgi:hypothetical protein
MIEQGPTKDQQQPIAVPGKGPNVATTLDLPPDPKRIKAFMAMVRKDVLDRRLHPQADS